MEPKTHVIIAGSTDMVGSLILKKCLERSDVFVTTIVRKPTGVSDPKLKEIVHTDYLDYSTIKQYFKDQDICFYCIGVYTGQVLEDEFIKITVDYTKAFAETLREQSDNTNFCFLSGQGADSKENSSVLFAKYKGIAENILISLNFKCLHLFRPGYIYPVNPRKEPNLLYRVMRLLYKPLIKPFFPGFSITSEGLANAMVKVGFEGGNKLVYENCDIRRL